MSTLKSDPCLDIILDFIAGGVPGNPIGESGGNYNAVIGDAHGTTDLSAYDIVGIYGLMTTLVDSGLPSSAVGRYQFIRGTMQATVHQMGVPNTTKFTPPFQDAMCVELLKSACQLDDWRSGNTDDDDFAHRLSTQWASLPDPQNGGRSHYDGDSAGNHASTTLDAVWAMLQRAADADGGTAPDAPTPAPAAPDPVPYAIKQLQAALGVTADGIYGPHTAAALAAYVAAVKSLQAALGMPIDGVWGQQTETAFTAYLGHPHG